MINNISGHAQKDGMLSMRARPPPADDFIDIFQKIKWAFNLLVSFIFQLIDEGFLQHTELFFLLLANCFNLNEALLLPFITLKRKG